MKKGISLITFVLLSINLVLASSIYSVNKYSCAQVDEKIANINSQMRSGYSAQQGERFRDQLRSLKKLRDKCKKKKYSTSE